MVRYTTLQGSCNVMRAPDQYVGSGAMNVGRRPQLESMIVGLAGCSIASQASN
jgi:hypothetical protein